MNMGAFQIRGQATQSPFSTHWVLRNLSLKLSPPTPPGGGGKISGRIINVGGESAGLPIGMRIPPPTLGGLLGFPDPTGCEFGACGNGLAPNPLPTIGQAVGQGLSTALRLVAPVLLALTTATLAGGWTKSFPTVQEVETECQPVGPPVLVPSIKYPGGTSEEQQYLRPDEQFYTVHKLKDRNGT